MKGVLTEQRREPGEDIFLILPILFGEKICYNNSVHDFILRMPGGNMDRLEQLLRNLRDRCPELELRTEEPMSRHTTFRIGGPAALMALPRTVGEAKAAVRAAGELEIRPFFLGNGLGPGIGRAGVRPRHTGVPGGRCNDECRGLWR